MSYLVYCPTCDSKMSVNAKSCPSCGETGFFENKRVRTRQTRSTVCCPAANCNNGRIELPYGFRAALENGTSHMQGSTCSVCRGSGSVPNPNGEEVYESSDLQLVDIRRKV